MPTIEQLLAVAEVTLLEIGGVDNWDWYSEAMAEYNPTGDEYQDAENFLNALENNGVDNWDWYGESLTGLSEYEDYLRALPDINQAIDIYAWKIRQEESDSQEEPAQAKTVIPKAKVANRPEGVADGMIYDHVVSKMGADRADDVYASAIENGLWKQSTFPKEFKVAIKEIQAGVKEPLEAAKKKLASLIIKNGKLDNFLRELQSPMGAFKI